MSLTQKSSALGIENSLIAARIVQNCKNHWANRVYAGSGSNPISLEQANHFSDFHGRLWSQLTYALSTGNDHNLLEFLHSVGRELARAHVPLPQVVEQGGLCVQGLLEQALVECENNPELNANPKALHHFLSRFNRMCS